MANASIAANARNETVLGLAAGQMSVVALGDVNGNLLTTIDNSDGTSSLVPKAYRDSIVTTQGSSTQTGPTAATVIATVTPGTAGLWEVIVTISVSGVSAVAVESNNMGLYQTATARLAPIPFAATTAGVAVPVTTAPIILSLSAVDTVNVKAIANATATAIYAAAIVCRRVG